MPERPTGDIDRASSDAFDTTEWSLVLAAADTNSPEGDAALESLCRSYWYPLYAYVRRRGHDADSAQDLTQGFFARLLEKRWLKTVSPERGRFRTFLMVAMDHFLANEYDRAHAAKRGGGCLVVSLDDTQAGEKRFVRDAEASVPLESAFDRDWATAVLDRALTRLEQDYTAMGKAQEFADWRGFLSREATKPACESSGTRLGMKPGAVAVGVHRLRHRYAMLLRQEVVRTLADPADLDEELRHLFRLLNH